ncbi:AAA family ATPase [Microbaculum marinum]|uniref:AAA family ATPase n=1 Tax=Microbaculum marinum TaxID=1764581 RepID=A0AAW9RVI8_9HYPH
MRSGPHHRPHTSRFVILSGCSGGGKTTLLAELARRGYAVVEEPGRRIVREESRTGGTALPWRDMEAFARRAIETAHRDMAALEPDGSWVFFDRGLIDAAAALEHVTQSSVLDGLAAARSFHRRVFLVPPWPEIFVEDAERRHGLDSAIAEYERLVRIYAALGYQVDILPRIGVERRADHVLKTLAED